MGTYGIGIAQQAKELSHYYRSDGSTDVQAYSQAGDLDEGHNYMLSVPVVEKMVVMANMYPVTDGNEMDGGYGKCVPREEGKRDSGDQHTCFERTCGKK